MRRARMVMVCVTAAILASFAPGSRGEETAAPQPGLDVTLRTRDDATYPRSSLVITMTFINQTTTPVTLDAAAFAPAAFRIVDARGKGPGKVKPGGPEPQSVRIDGMETLEHQVDLSAWYPDLTSKLRVWEVSWSHGEHEAAPFTVKITRPYDRGKDRTAVVETDLGRMVWRLMPEHAPAHVKHFVDLVRQGFYDGLSIYKATPGLIAEGGDPNGDGTGGWDRLLMPEMSKTLEMKMGLIGALRRESSVTNNFIFFITLGPNEYMTGLQTFFAEVDSGMDVVARLFKAPSHGDSGDIRAFMLTPPVKIHRITIGR